MLERLKNQIEQIKTDNCYRYAVNTDPFFINMSGNDYLGIATNQNLREEFLELTKSKIGFGSYSSRLLAGDHSQSVMFENDLERMYNRPALAFNSGYHANCGLLPAITTKTDLIIADKMIHASTIDGIRLSDAHFERFKHNDVNHLIRIIEKFKGKFDNIIIAVESIYSMDGDMAPLKEIVDIKNKYGAFLIVDEAHSLGLYGETGLGLCQELGIMDDVDIIIGTLGKAIASVGAFVICHSVVKEFLINRMRSFIFTTALAPINFAWSRFVMNKVQSMNHEREYLKSISSNLRSAITNNGFKTLGESAIVPFMAFDNSLALQWYEIFKNNHIDARPVRYPTVPQGTARIRFSLSATLTTEDINKVSSIIGTLPVSINQTSTIINEQ